MDLRTSLLQQADEYCRTHGITRARLGMLVLKDNKFFDQIEKGARSFTSRTYEKFQAFFREGTAA